MNFAAVSTSLWAALILLCISIRLVECAQSSCGGNERMVHRSRLFTSMSLILLHGLHPGRLKRGYVFVICDRLRVHAYTDAVRIVMVRDRRSDDRVYQKINKLCDIRIGARCTCTCITLNQLPMGLCKMQSNYRNKTMYISSPLGALFAQHFKYNSTSVITFTYMTNINKMYCSIRI